MVRDRVRGGTVKGSYVLLRALEERLPSPRPEQRHTLAVHANVVVLTVMMGDSWTAFDLTEEDLSRDPLELVAEVEALVARDREP